MVTSLTDPLTPLLFHKADAHHDLDVPESILQVYHYFHTYH